MTNEPVLLAGIIPRSRLTGLEIFHVITLAGSARATKPATGQRITHWHVHAHCSQSLCKHDISSCNTRITVTSSTEKRVSLANGPAGQPGSCNQHLTALSSSLPSLLPSISERFLIFQIRDVRIAGWCCA